MELSKMFGVERDTDFGVKGYEPLRFNISTTPKGVDRLYFKDTDGWLIFAKAEMLTDIIYGAPGNIIHLPPPLTDEQREQLRAIWTLGGRYLAKNKNGVCCAHSQKPTKADFHNTWIIGGNTFEILHGLSITNLVSWSDPEPFDIGKALGVGE